MPYPKPSQWTKSSFTHSQESHQCFELWVYICWLYISATIWPVGTYMSLKFPFLKWSSSSWCFRSICFDRSNRVCPRTSMMYASLSLPEIMSNKWFVPWFLRMICNGSLNFFRHSPVCPSIIRQLISAPTHIKTFRLTAFRLVISCARSGLEKFWSVPLWRARVYETQILRSWWIS